jgi:hypothetical protein
MSRPGARGFTYAEVVAGLTVFGIALSGLILAAAAQLRLIEALEGRSYLLVSQGATLQVIDNAPGEGGLTYTYILGSGATDITAATDVWAGRLGVARLANRDVRRRSLPATIVAPPALQMDAGGQPFQHFQDVTLETGLVETADSIVAVVRVQAVPP